MLKRITIIFLLTLMYASYSFSQEGWEQKFLGNANLVSINFINSHTGYIFRSDKYIFKTTTSGVSWDSSLINAQGLGIRQGCFITESNGAFMPVPGITTNGGSSWNQGSIPSVGSFYPQNIYLHNDSTAFLSGVDLGNFVPYIFKTTNAGLNWNQVFAGGGANNYADITFINDNTGFQCRFTILKTTDKGSSWFTLSHTSRQRTKFSKVFGDTMYLSSANGYVAKSIDLGANWTETYTGINQLLTDIYFINNHLGYAVGDSGGIVKTTNGGLKWSIQNSGTNKKLNEVWFLNKDTGFIAGDSGLLLVTYNGGVTSLSQNYQSIPEKFQLHQNYPNPFNPSTIIRFDLIQSGYTRLSVYDISGKRISVLVDENLSPGSYEYNFNAENLPSGVYFYKIESEAFTETKRMILIK